MNIGILWNIKSQEINFIRAFIKTELLWFLINFLSLAKRITKLQLSNLFYIKLQILNFLKIFLTNFYEIKKSFFKSLSLEKLLQP